MKTMKNIFYIILIAIFVICLFTLSSLIFDNMLIDILKDFIIVLVLLLDSLLLMLLY